MRSSIVAIIVLLAVSVTGFNAFAESGERSKGGRSGMPGGGWGDSSQFVDKMAEHLQLDETQRQSVQNIFDAAKPEMEALRESMKAGRETMRALDADDPNRLFLKLSIQSYQLCSNMSWVCIGSMVLCNNDISTI